MKTIVIIIWIGTIQKTLATTEDRDSIEKKLKASLALNEISNYMIYSLENFLKYHGEGKN